MTALLKRERNIYCEMQSENADIKIYRHSIFVYLLDTVTVLFFGACENTPRNNLLNTRKQKVTILILKFVDIFFFRFLSFFLFYNSRFSRISGIRNPINHQNEKRPLRKPSMKYFCPLPVTYVVMRSMPPWLVEIRVTCVSKIPFSTHSCMGLVFRLNR